jgi:hypothetical protein
MVNKVPCLDTYQRARAIPVGTINLLWLPSQETREGIGVGSCGQSCTRLTSEYTVAARKTHPACIFRYFGSCPALHMMVMPNQAESEHRNRHGHRRPPRTLSVGTMPY